jgi:hypothetical protein
MVPEGFPFDWSQPAGQVLAIVLFLIPGLNATWVVERLAGRTTLAATERLLRAMAWSVLIYALASPWLLRIGHRLAAGTRLWPWEPLVGFAGLIFIAPVVLGVAMHLARRGGAAAWILRKLTRIHPAPTPWDFAFSRKGAFYVRMEMHDGTYLGGLYAEGSFASAYPENDDLFLEQAWRLDEEGSFVEPVDDSAGLLISRELVRAVELLEPEAEGGRDG